MATHASKLWSTHWELRHIRDLYTGDAFRDGLGTSIHVCTVSKSVLLKNYLQGISRRRAQGTFPPHINFARVQAEANLYLAKALEEERLAREDRNRKRFQTDSDLASLMDVAAAFPELGSQYQEDLTIWS